MALPLDVEANEYPSIPGGRGEGFLTGLSL